MRNIAPGQWDGEKRQLAKAWALVVGGVLIVGGLRVADGIVRSLESGGTVGMWSVVLAGVPLVIGSLAVFPNVLTPILYRLIDKFLKDSE